MAECHETSRFERIEFEACKEQPLLAQLRFFGLLFAPVWVLAAAAAVAELSLSSLPDNVYGTVNMALAAYPILIAVPAIFLSKRADRRQAELAQNNGGLSSYQLGIGAIKVAIGNRIHWVGAIPLVLIFILNEVVGGDRTEMTAAARFWYAQEIFACVAGLIFCFLGFCVWLGHRVHKQRAA